MNRRDFLLRSSLAAGACALRPHATAAQTSPAPASRIAFETSDAARQKTYDAALGVLARNITQVAGYQQPVLIEGSSYSGVWLECAPHEGLVYADIRSDIARNNHLAFFALQRDDGQIPCWSRTTATGF